MAQQWFLTDVASDNGGSGEKALSLFRGYKSATHVTATTASGTSIQETLTSGGTPGVYLSPIMASGTNETGNVTATLRALESTTAVNAGLGIVVEAVDATNSTVLATFLAETGLPTTATITELTASDAAKALTAAAITAFNPSTTWRLRVTIKVKNVGTMAVGTVTTSVNGPTSAAAGDSSVTMPVAQTIFNDTTKPFIAAMGTTGADNGSSNGTTAPVPTGSVSGSLITLIYGAYWSGSGLTPATTDFTLPTGFTDSGKGLLVFTDTGDGITFALGTAYKYASASEGTTYTLACSATVGGGGNVGSLMKAYLWGGTCPTSGNPFDSFQTSSNGNGTSAAITSFTPGGNNYAILGFSYAFTNNQQQPDKFIKAAHEQNLAGFTFNASTSYSIQGTAAATGTLTFSTDQTSWIAAVAAVVKSAPSGLTGSASLTGTATLAAAGTRGVSQTATLTGTATVTTGGALTGSSSGASITVSSTRTAAGTTGNGVAVSVTATISAAGSVTTGFSGGATRSTTATITAGGSANLSQGATTLTATATITAAGGILGQGAASRATVATITAAGVAGYSGTASLSVTATVTPAGSANTPSFMFSWWTGQVELTSLTLSGWFDGRNIKTTTYLGTWDGGQIA